METHTLLPELTKRLEAQGREIAGQQAQLHKQEEAIRALADHLNTLNRAITLLTVVLDRFNEMILTKGEIK